MEGKFIVFDIYGTLINPSGIAHLLEKFLPEKSSQVLNTWRQKQLEYSFRRGLMQDYVDFSICTAQALDYSCATHKVDLSIEQKHELLLAYKTLPAFTDVKVVLKQLSDADYKIAAFSNGSKSAVHQLLQNQSIIEYFTEIVSVENVESFKPAPIVYDHMIKKCQSDPNHIVFVSANSFDILGAQKAGIKNCYWLKRSAEEVFDPWETAPNKTIQTLSELPSYLKA